ncbi:MAG: CerR family C-terminal domain-containing protein [Thermoguttaceae bacterium]|jgi:AcrR family transcriptional regulator
MFKGQNGEETRKRLLAAATEVFAEVGFRAATLREICRRGRANIAAVNYHFRDKEQLYTAVLDQAIVAAAEGLALFVSDSSDPPEEKLRHFIHGVLHQLLGDERPIQLLRLMAHESVEPTPALDLVVEKAARPLNKILGAIVAELLGMAADSLLVRDCAASVLAQCVSYDHSQALIQRLDHLNVHDPATIDNLADHVFRFSLGGIRALAVASSPAGCGLPGAKQSRNEAQP